MGYVVFILIFIVGISDSKSPYHIEIPLLKTPYMISVMVCDLVILVVFFMMEIALGS